MKTLLVIFAHTDDESHGPGTTLAKYAAEGVKVYLCARHVAKLAMWTAASLKITAAVLRNCGQPCYF